MDLDVVGSTGVVIVATRVGAGVGEVLLRHGGGSQTYLALSEEPIEKGTAVLVIGNLGGRTVSVIRLSGSN